MPRVVIDPAIPDRELLDNEIARLRGLDIGELRARWHTVFRRRAPPHLTRHLLFRILAYRLQAYRLGELDVDSRRLLDRIGSGSAEGINRLVAELNRSRTELRPGTLLTREWDGHLQRVMVLADGFSWNGKTYGSLSKVAFAMTGSRWNGPRFFGLRDRPSSEARP
jgi:phosphatidylserine/phosphatidylglycerophosphate/cardiolipin synthase-like enzyme